MKNLPFGAAIFEGSGLRQADSCRLLGCYGFGVVDQDKVCNLLETEQPRSAEPQVYK